jgi:hypothetical protein
MIYGARARKPEAAPESVEGLPLDPTSPTRTVTLRDDRLDFPALRDAAAACRRAYARLRIVDHGRLTVSELEWLGEAGADIYTSDKARVDGAELVLIRKAARRGDALTVYFVNAPFSDAPAAGTAAYETLRELGRSGLDLHVSDGIHPREIARLGELAYDCRRGDAAFVLHRHGALEAPHVELAAQGVWINVSSREAALESALPALLDCARAAREAQAGLVLHIENPIEPLVLADLSAAGAFLLFKTPPSDYRSPLRPFEEAAKAVRLENRAFYLFTDAVL